MANYAREPAKEVQLPARLPLVGLLNQRAASPFEDSRLVNGYIEKGDDGELQVVKRPGLSVLYTLTGWGAGMLGDIALFYRAIEGGFAGALYESGVSEVSSLASYTSAASVPNRFFYLEEVPTGLGTFTYFLHNKYAAFLYDYTVDASTSVPISGTAVGPLTCSITNGSPIVTTASTSSIFAFSSVTGTGIPASTTIESIDSTTQFTMSANSTATNASASLSFVLSGIPDNGLDVSITGNALLAGGVVDLNRATYLLTPVAQLIGSELDQPDTYNPLNLILAYAEQNFAVYVGKQVEHIVVYKDTTIEVFRDAAATGGSPLARVDGLRLDVGLYGSRLISEIDGALIWVSQTESGQRSVWLMENLRAGEVATPQIKRLLSGTEPAYAISFSVAGHSFFAITDPEAGYTAVYDLNMKYWSYWNALGETYFPFVASTSVAGVTRLQHESDGKIYAIDPDNLTDADEVFAMDVYPPEFDAGMRVSKYLAWLRIVADQTEGSRLLVRNNDSGQFSGRWTNWRELDLAQSQPTLDNCGSFIKRFYHFRHERPTACRLRAVELNLLPGLF